MCVHVFARLNIYLLLSFCHFFYPKSAYLPERVHPAARLPFRSRAARTQRPQLLVEVQSKEQIFPLRMPGERGVESAHSPGCYVIDSRRFYLHENRTPTGLPKLRFFEHFEDPKLFRLTWLTREKFFGRNFFFGRAVRHPLPLFSPSLVNDHARLKSKKELLLEGWS
jgi:hypothetical protein